MTLLEIAAKAGNAAYQKAAYDAEVDWETEVSDDEKRFATESARAIFLALAQGFQDPVVRNAILWAAAEKDANG